MSDQPDEDWFADVISDSLEMDWTSRDAARLIMQRLSEDFPAGERTAAMDALIADSADMTDDHPLTSNPVDVSETTNMSDKPPPASADALGEVERVAKALAKADGLDWDEVCGVDADPDEGYCDSGTCVAAHWEEHDAEQARRWYMHLATAAMSAISPAGEVERMIERLIEVRRKNAANFDRNGAAWEAYDRAVLDCITAIRGA